VTRTVLAAALAGLAACGTTGGSLISFDVTAQGTGSNVAEAPNGWHVVLTRARLHIGAVYLNASVPNSGAQATNCILPGSYTGQELEALDVDVLSATPQPFPAPATGTDDAVRAGEVWLTGGDINAMSDSTVIVDLAGSATSGATVLPFSATFQLDSQDWGQISTGAQPSLHPICKLRIVSPILVDLQPHAGGTLAITVNPSRWFAGVDFAALPPDGAFPNDRNNSNSNALFGSIGRPAAFQLSFH
jgi:hypothetical protein